MFYDKEIPVTDTQLAILFDSRESVSYEYLINRYQETDIMYLCNNRLLLDKENVWNEYNIQYAEIEVNTICNYFCEYCPNKIYSKRKKVMSLIIFEKIIQQLVRLGTLQYVTFHAYNEPLLDPLFEERLHYLKTYGVKLELFTNASNLTKNIVDAIEEYGMLRTIKINLPSLDPKTFTVMTGFSDLQTVMKNIEYALQKKLNMEIICNGTSRDFEKNLPILKRYFRQYNVFVKRNSTNDRAGLVKGKYAMKYHFPKRLSGCNQLLTWIHFNVDGDVYLCFMDYFQNYKFGNIFYTDLKSILECSEMQAMRKQVFGMKSAEDYFICRRCWNNLLARRYRYASRELNVIS